MTVVASTAQPLPVESICASPSASTLSPTLSPSLDFYQKPNGWFEIGANDMSLRKCLETKVDIYRSAAG